MASSKSRYRIHRPGTQTGAGASTGGYEAGSSCFVARDGGQSKLVLPSSSLHTVSEYPGWVAAFQHELKQYTYLHFSWLGSWLQLLGANVRLLWRRRLCGDTWRSGSGLAEDGELSSLCCGLHQRLAQQRATARPLAQSRVGTL